VLFFKLGSNEGLLVELEGDAVVNIGTIQVKPGKVTVEETHGGVYSYQRVSELAKYMLTLNFTFLMPRTIYEALKAKSKQLCVTQ
jgi:hypothetical protein